MVSSRWLRTAVFCLLYFCQGLPWGFATIALLATLSGAGFDKAETATIAAMAILPWTLKFFWAPMIDSFRWLSLGNRRPWIIIAQLGMAATLFGAWNEGLLESNSVISYLGWVLFVHNCFASLQDVATDALAVDLLDDRERGPMLGFMWAAKLIGISAGGAGLAVIIANAGLAAAIVIQAAVILGVCALMLLIRERAGERLLPWSAGSAQLDLAPSQLGLLSTLRHLTRAFSDRNALLLLFVAATALLVEGLFDPLTTEFFVQQLGWSPERFSANRGTWGVAGEMAGALSGGMLAARYGGRRIAMLGMIIVMLIMLTYSLTSVFWDHPRYPHLVMLPLFRGFVAFTTVCLFSTYMQACWTPAAATQFTLYMTFNNIAYSLGAKLNSWLPAAGVTLDYAQYYLLGGLLPLLGLVLVYFTVDRDREDPARSAEAGLQTPQNASAGV